ncbi:Hypothetical Protein ygbQ [Candidatus Moranella endobia PCVAL]|nr:Hypothetical Protein ygbQ [Candidatus Moranella endobia PCVAL]
MRKLTLLLLALLSWLQYALWLGKNGMHDFGLIKNDIVIKKSNNAQLIVRNDHLLSKLNQFNNC